MRGAYRPLDPKTGEEQSQWVMPPGADWHPIAIEQMEEHNRLLQQKARESASRNRTR